MEKANPTVLLIEDSPYDEFFVQRALAKECPEVVLVVARDGVEAKDRLFGSDINFDLVLVDLRLPKISGLELIEQIREDSRYAATPVFVMTGSEDPVESAKCRKAGASDVLFKSIDHKGYCAQITGALSRLLRTQAEVL